MIRISFLGTLVASLLIFAAVWLDETVALRAKDNPHAIQVDQLPENFANWLMIENSEMEHTSRQVLDLDSYVRRAYRDKDGNLVFLYVGYWQKQSGDKQSAKHTPRLCLPSNGWLISAQPAVQLESAKGKELTASVILGQYQMTQSLFYYWFFTGERTFYQDWKALIYIGIERLLSGRSDGGIVEISTVLNREKYRDRAQEMAQDTLQRFSADFWPLLLDMTNGDNQDEKP